MQTYIFMVLHRSPAVVLVIHAHPRCVSAFHRVVTQELHEWRVASELQMLHEHGSGLA